MYAKTCKRPSRYSCEIALVTPWKEALVYPQGTRKGLNYIGLIILKTHPLPPFPSLRQFFLFKISLFLPFGKWKTFTSQLWYRINVRHCSKEKSLEGVFFKSFKHFWVVLVKINWVSVKHLLSFSSVCHGKEIEPIWGWIVWPRTQQNVNSLELRCKTSWWHVFYQIGAVVRVSLCSMIAQTKWLQLKQRPAFPMSGNHSSLCRKHMT